MRTKIRQVMACAGVLLALGFSPLSAEDDLPGQAEQAMKRAATFYHKKVASHGGLMAKCNPPCGFSRLRRIIQSLDEYGRWISYYSGERLVGQPTFRMNEAYVSSAVFSQNMTKLSDYIARVK